MEKEESSNYQLFKDCLATLLIQMSAENQPIKQNRKSRKYSKRETATSQVPEQKNSSDLEELAEFIDVRSLWLNLSMSEEQLMHKSILHTRYLRVSRPLFEQSLTRSGSIHLHYNLFTQMKCLGKQLYRS